jgi:hypothetical protein
MLNINLVWDANALAAPQSFRDSIQAAAAVLEAAIYDPITVNIGIGYNEYDNGTIPLSGTVSLGGVATGIPTSYSALRAALMGNESSSTDIAAYNALPATTTLNGSASFDVTRALAKAMGALPANDTGIDGYAGFPSTFVGAGLADAGIVELLHAMGLLNAVYPLSLFEYTSPGVHLLSNGTAATPAYFSLDGGVTSLGNYDVGFDSTLFSNVTGDPLSVPNQGLSVLTPLDLTEIGVIGFDVTGPKTIAAPVVTPTTTAAGSAPTVALQAVTVTRSIPIVAAALIQSASVGSGDAIISYDFTLELGSNGHFVLDGVVQPSTQDVRVLATQLDTLEYIAPATTGTDTIIVEPIDEKGLYGSFLTTTITTVVGTAPAAPAAPFNASTATKLTTTSGTNTVQLTAANTVVTSLGTDFITDPVGSAIVTTSGNARIVGGAGTLSVQGGAGNDVVFAGTGSLIFTGGTGFDTVVGGGNRATIIGGSGGGLFQGGGNATITAGAGGAQNVIFGSNGDQMYGQGSAGVLFGDNGGNAAKTTLLSSLADTGNSVFFGASGTGQMTFITGAGNDMLAVGQGLNTAYLGSGSDIVFANAATAGSTTVYAGTGNATVVMGGAMTDLVIASGGARNFVVYNDAASTDRITLLGYGDGQVANAIAGQISAGGGSILQLGDGSSIALVGVQHATAALFS